VRKIHSACILLVGFFAICSLLSAYLGNSRMKNKNRLNLLLITIDTLRADRLSCYTNEHLNTPNIDSMANRGILFTRAFAHTSTTLPSHTNILLGTTPLYHGVHDNSNFKVDEKFLCLAELLKQYNYSTGAFIGAFPLDSRFGISQGFDLYDDDYDIRNSKTHTGGERKADIVMERAINWLEQQKSPWFLWIHCWDPHDPYYPPEPFKSRFSNDPYNGEVAYVDYVLGKLFSHLKKNNLWDTSLIIFTGDHGESLWEHDEETHGVFAYNSTIWIPLIFSVPGTKPREVNQYVSHIDIFPTICEVLEIEKPAFLQGISLLPAIKGKQLQERIIYIESLYPFYSRGWAPLRGYVYGGEKFIDSPIPELYNLENDFSESENLASKNNLKGYQKKLGQIISELSLEESSQAKYKLDRESLEKLKSLGYISDRGVPTKKSYGPDHDVKVLIHYHNKSVKAFRLYKEGNAREAINLLKEVITERNCIGIAYKNLAQIYDEQDRLNDAIEVLELGLEAAPSYYEIFHAYVNLLMRAGRYDKVIEVINTQNSLQMEINPGIWSTLGLAYWSKGNLSDAKKAYEKSISMGSKLPVPFSNLGALYFFLYQKTNDMKTYNKAIENFKKAIELDPFYQSAYYGLGLAYLEVSNFEEAIRCFKKVLELKSDDGEAMLHLGFTYMSKGDKINACKYFTALKSSPSYNSLSSEDKTRLEKWIQECDPKKK